MWNQTTICKACLIDGIRLCGVEDSLKEIYMKLIGDNSSNEGSILSFCDKCTDILRSIKTFREQCLISNCKLKVKAECQVEAESASECRFDNGLEDSFEEEEPVILKSEVQNVETCELKSGSNLIVKKDPKENRRQKKTYICDLCLQSFKLKTKLTAHIKNHKKLTCKICHELFQSSNDLNIHKVAHQKCKQKLRADDKKSSKMKQKIESNGSQKIKAIRTFPCAFCFETFESKKEMVAHRNSHNKYSCKICHETLPSADALKAHRTSHSTSKRVMCHICCQELSSSSTLRQHIDRMHSKLIVPCSDPSCEKLFGSESVMQEHVRLIHDTKTQKWICDLCGDVKTRKAYLRAHIKRKHLKMKLKKKCPYCNKMYKLGYLPDHIMYHTGKRRHKCAECPMQFITRSELVKHAFTHAGNLRPFNCKLCDVGYYQTLNLRRHYFKVHGSEYLGFIKKDPFKDRIYNS